MPPEDPYGRGGVSLDNLLRKRPMQPSVRPQNCPYGQKCTYGNKCRFYHPERGFTPQKTVTEKLKEHAEQQMQEINKDKIEKTRRPKQKLSRTKSVIPVESASTNSKVKPKFGHSKSLIDKKTDDYLTESRKKMEAAQLSAEVQKISLQHRSLVSPPFQEFTENHRIKPELQQRILTETSSLPPINTSMFFSNEQQSSPKHLMVPKQEQQERYLSGHLLVAKKLSDEGSDASFFSEHHSSPSSTRTSSPAGSHKNVSRNKSSSFESLLESSHDGSLDNLSYSYPLEPNRLKSPTSNSDCQNSLPFSSCDSVLTENSGNLSDGMNIYQFTRGGVDTPLSPHYAIDESQLRYQNNPSTQSSSFSPSQNSQGQMSTNVHNKSHPGLRRALSSTPQDKQVPQFVDIHEHLSLRSQHSEPISPRSRRPSHPVELSRQNSSSDSQIYYHHNDIGLGERLAINTPQERKGSVDVETTLHQQVLQRQLLYHGQLPSGMPHTGQSSNGTHMTRRPSIPNSPVDAVSISNHFTPMSSNIGFPQYAQAEQSHFPAQPQQFQQHPYPTQQQPQNQHFYHQQQPQQFTPHHQQNMFNQHSYPQRLPLQTFYSQQQQYSQSSQSILSPPPTFPQHAFNFQSQPQQFHPQSMFPPYSPQVQASGNILVVSPPPMLPEDTPILQTDTDRYALYCKLVPLFDEWIVRKVMNQNPHVLSPDELCPLIIQFKNSVKEN